MIHRQLFCIVALLLALSGCRETAAPPYASSAASAEWQKDRLKEGSPPADAKNHSSIEKTTTPAKKDQADTIGRQGSEDITVKNIAVKPKEQEATSAAVGSQIAPTTANNTKVQKSKSSKISTSESTTTNKAKYAAEMTFEHMTYDFGEITEGEVVDHEFVFVNTSKYALEISSATATCGCTRPTYPFITVHPGESNKIAVTYNSVGKSGKQEPEISIVANTNPKTTVLKLKGTVLSKADDKADKQTTNTTVSDSTTIKTSPSPSRIRKNKTTKIEIKRDSL